MPNLSFHVESAEAQPFTVTPLLAFKLRITNVPADEVIHSVMLQCQVRLEPHKRRYEAVEQESLHDLFGEPSRWSQTVRSMLWTHTSVVVPPFSGSVVVDLPLPCTFDFNVAVTKYFHALKDGDVPLLLLFSGTVFYQDGDGSLQVTQLSWASEVAFRLPVAVWCQMMDLYYPNSAWLCLRRDVFERLYQYKVCHGLPTWEQAMEQLLAAAKDEP